MESNYVDQDQRDAVKPGYHLAAVYIDFSGAIIPIYTWLHRTSTS